MDSEEREKKLNEILKKLKLLRSRIPNNGTYFLYKERGWHPQASDMRYIHNIMWTISVMLEKSGRALMINRSIWEDFNLLHQKCVDGSLLSDRYNQPN